MRTAEQIATETPDATPERLARLEEWVQTYVPFVRQSWIEQGTDVETEETRKILEWVADDVRCTDIPEWMPLLAAMTHAAHIENVAPITGEVIDRDKYRNAMRTIKASTQDERDAAICYQMGWEQLSLNKFREQHSHLTTGSGATHEGECSLYRYFDEAGDLLYVGVANDPNMRDDQHRVNSKWHRFSVDRRVEWFPTRGEALDAERDAIATESPVFNLTHASRAQKAAALDYLFDRLADTA